MRNGSLAECLGVFGCKLGVLGCIMYVLGVWIGVWMGCLGEY